MAPQRNAGSDAEAELPEYAGHYRLESCLGSGGMGVVHLARSTSGMKVAVKVVHARFAEDPEFRGRFRQEVAAARRVSGAFTAPVVDADPEARRPWMATLFIPGSTLSDQVKRNGPMSTGELRRLMAGLAEALRDIHRVGVVHRDLKPSNVLLAEDGPKVIDFGISRPKDSELRTETGKLIGTPPFMAPEQFRRPREVGPAADIFALGSVLVHAATGRGPFDSDSPYVVAYQVVHDEPDLTGVPQILAPLVQRCLAKEPEERPTPDELMRELRSVSASYDTQVFIPAPRDRDGDRERDQDQNLERDSLRLTGQADAAGEDNAGGSRAAGSRGDSEGDGHAEKGGAAPPAPRTRRRLLRPMAVAAGALSLVAGGVAAVQWAGGATAPGPTGGRTAPAGFSAWRSDPVSDAQTAPECSYGAGKLLCAQAGTVLALDPADGSPAWRHTVEAPLGSGAPVLVGGLVQPPAHLAPRLEALDPASGEVRWTADVPEYNALHAVGDMLLLTSPDGTVTGVDGATGRTAWSRTVQGQPEPYFTSFAGDPLAYVTSTSDSGRTSVTAVDPATGAVRWQAGLDGTLTAVGSHDGALLLLSVEDETGYTDAVVRYDPASKSTHRVKLPVTRQDPQAGVRGDVVYLLSTGGALEAVDMAGRRVLWQLETGVSRGSEPVSDGRHVYLVGADGRLLGVDARAGRLLGQTPARLGAHGDRVAASLPAPVVADGRVYGSAPDGTVFAVDGGDPAGW
ncbi:PQQ-binding-like beta-propeller repeat protein [Streptomyces sp. NPDC102395]|uniref:serine/threonine-protein kinase n=1 Tax=Streptomyces sp. NPDC102395 TaxID=3366168 RepID=UPI00380FAE6C